MGNNKWLFIFILIMIIFISAIYYFTYEPVFLSEKILESEEITLIEKGTDFAFEILDIREKRQIPISSLEITLEDNKGEEINPLWKKFEGVTFLNLEGFSNIVLDTSEMDTGEYTLNILITDEDSTSESKIKFSIYSAGTDTPSSLEGCSCLSIKAKSDGNSDPNLMLPPRFTCPMANGDPTKLGEGGDVSSTGIVTIKYCFEIHAGVGGEPAECGEQQKKKSTTIYTFKGPDGSLYYGYFCPGYNNAGEQASGISQTIQTDPYGNPTQQPGVAYELGYPIVACATSKGDGIPDGYTGPQSGANWIGKEHKPDIIHWIDAPGKTINPNSLQNTAGGRVLKKVERTDVLTHLVTGTSGGKSCKCFSTVKLLATFRDDRTLESKKATFSSTC